MNVKKPTPALFFLFFTAAFAVRGALFYFYIQHAQRYCQPDTVGYTMPAQALYHGMGMSSPNGAPVFWRTPGYPVFLAPFFDYSSSPNSWHFDHHEEAFKIAIWVQIAWCSLLPILWFLLAFILTHSYLIAYLLAGIALVHPGAVLASTFLLTDGPAQIFFTLFLLALCLVLRKKPSRPWWYLVGSAVSLAIYTWIRPMGQFVALAAALILFFSGYTRVEKIKQALIFMSIFALSIAPWFVRNYQLTGKAFFCPLFGLYFNVFNAPKIRARIEDIPHELAWRKQCAEAERAVLQEYQQRAATGDKRVIVNEMICLQPALPWIYSYPHLFAYDWCLEVLKTTFDLYTYQLVSLYNNTFKWDPLVEYLPEKLADALYAKPLPWYFRILVYLEFLFQVIIWIGIIGGTLALFTPEVRKRFLWLWLTCVILIGSVVGQTGGFGYARLRLPCEPLILILAAACWIYFLHRKHRSNNPI